MKLQVSGGIDTLTLIDEHGNTVCTFAKCDEETRKVANEIVRRVNEHDVLVAVRDAAKQLIARIES